MELLFSGRRCVHRILHGPFRIDFYSPRSGPPRFFSLSCKRFSSFRAPDDMDAADAGGAAAATADDMDAADAGGAAAETAGGAAAATADDMDAADGGCAAATAGGAASAEDGGDSLVAGDCVDESTCTVL
jgi:hypothetical protein